MKIIIAGGGKVGSALIRQLSAEGYEITLIDTERSVLEEAVNRYDVMAVEGNCAAMPVLEEADVAHTDLLIAAIGADETNLLCCMTAHKMNPKLHTIARIRNPEYSEQVYHMRDAFALSMVVNPERQAAIEIERLLRYPGFLRRDSFAQDRVEIVELRVDSGSPLKNQPLSSVGAVVGVRMLICAVLRNGNAVTPGGKFILEEGDRIFVTAPTSNLALLLKNLGVITRRVKRVMICGGGRITHYLTQQLEKSDIRVTVVEKDGGLCRKLAEQLPRAVVLHGDATNLSFLESEGLRDCDALVAMTGIDEMNMVISLYAGNCGVAQVITKLGHIESSQMLGNLSLGSIINPKELCSNIIVRYVRALKNQTDAALSVHTFADGQVEAQEFLVDETARYCGVPLKKLKLKKNVLIVCISHGPELCIPNGDSMFQKDDTVIVVTGRKHIIGRFNDIFEE